MRAYDSWFPVLVNERTLVQACIHTIKACDSSQVWHSGAQPDICNHIYDSLSIWFLTVLLFLSVKLVPHVVSGRHDLHFQVVSHKELNKPCNTTIRAGCSERNFAAGAPQSSKSQMLPLCG